MAGVLMNGAADLDGGAVATGHFQVDPAQRHDTAVESKSVARRTFRPEQNVHLPLCPLESVEFATVRFPRKASSDCELNGLTRALVSVASASLSGRTPCPCSSVAQAP